MTTLLQWFTRDLLGLRSNSAMDSDYSLFEQVDGDDLSATDHRLSDSMRYDDMPVYDFPETLPHLTRIDPALAALHRQAAIRSIFSPTQRRGQITSA